MSVGVYVWPIGNVQLRSPLLWHKVMLALFLMLCTPLKHLPAITLEDIKDTTQTSSSSVMRRIHQETREKRCFVKGRRWCNEQRQLPEQQWHCTDQTQLCEYEDHLEFDRIECDVCISGMGERVGRKWFRNRSGLFVTNSRILHGRWKQCIT